MDADETTKTQLQIHQLLSQELRHTATVIWQFSIAIVTLQGGAVGLSGQSAFNSTLGKAVLAGSFFLSLCFSLMLVRQARERSGFVRRIRAVEDELGKVYPTFFMPIPRALEWFKSEFLAWVLVIESTGGLTIFLVHVGFFSFLNL